LKVRSERFFDWYAAFLQRRYGTVLIVGLVLTALGAWSASRFELRTDFAELLPQDEPSIRDLNRAKERMGGLANLIVSVEGQDPKANRRLIDALVEKYESLPEEFVTYLKYHINDEKEFYEKHKQLYADLVDLEEIRRRLQAKIRYERIKNNPVLNLDFDGETPEPVEFDLSDIREKYEKKVEGLDRYQEGYFNTEQGHLWAILVYPPQTSTGVDFGKRMRRAVIQAAAEVCHGGPLPPAANPEQVVEARCPERFGPTIRVGFTGSIVTAIVEQKAIIDDLVLVTSICLSLVGLVVLLYFRRLRALPIVGVPLLMGTTWTFGISIFIVGHLNTSTAFLAAIIVGNGINFGLIQLARFAEERRAGVEFSQALCSSLKYTAKATSIAALAASIAYGSLIITRFRGFNGFGYMGGIGMILCWISAFSMQPALLLLLQRIRSARFDRGRKGLPQGFLFGPYSRFVERRGTWLNALGWTFAVVCLAVAIPYLKDPFEYNFRNLRNQTEGHQVYVLSGRVGEIFKRRMDPMFILADRPDQVPLIMFELTRNNQQGPHKDLFHEIHSIFTLLPREQPAKIRTLKKIRRLLTKSTLSWLSDEDRKELDKYLPPPGLRPLTPADLPATMTRMFTEKNGRVGLPIALYPRHGRSVWDGHFLIELSNASRSVRLPDGEEVTSSGVSTIFADMILAIERDGPRAVIASLIGVMLLVVLAYRSIKYILIILVALFFGVAWTIGPVAMIDMKLNFLNFIGLPITFGIGIDYAVNVLNRYRNDGPGSMKQVIASTGGAVSLCSLTTIIGYSSLLIANNQALVSFGLLSVIGELASLAAAILLMPALVMILERHSQRKTSRGQRAKASPA
jgi:predicted RND superfamily exporter protein